MFGLFGKGEVASVELEPSQIDGTGANALTTTFQSAPLELPAGEWEVQVDCPLPAPAHQPPSGLSLRLLSAEVEGFDHRQTVAAGSKRLEVSVPLRLTEAAACAFYVEVGGVHIGERLRLRVR